MEISFQIDTQSVVLLPQRAAFLPQMSTLLIADLHLGKGDHLAIHGAPIPSTVNRSILNEAFARLEFALNRTTSKRLIILGDVIHAATGLTDEVVELTLTALRGCRDRGVELIFIAGNHDRGLSPLAQQLEVQLVTRHTEGPFAFVHDPVAALTNAFTFCGHLHPAVHIGGGVPRAPAFWRRANMCVLPAFSRFTGGMMPPVKPGDELFIIADQQIVHRRITHPAASGTAVQPMPAT